MRPKKITNDFIIALAKCLENGEAFGNACIRCGATPEIVNLYKRKDPLIEAVLNNARERYLDNVRKLKERYAKEEAERRNAAREKKRIAQQKRMEKRRNEAVES